MKKPNSPIPPPLYSPLFLFLPITPLLSNLSNNAICLFPQWPLCHTCLLTPFSFAPFSIPCLTYEWYRISMLRFHPLIITSIKVVLGPRWPDSTLALGPLNANKGLLWIIDINTTNEETLSWFCCWHTHAHTHDAHGRTCVHNCIDNNYCFSWWCPFLKKKQKKKT